MIKFDHRDDLEGDAIIAFFGAPVDIHDHARRASLAAVKMKRVEKRLNEHFTAEKLAPTPLHTRIGINTGSMVVGNMGTPQKMDYTIMGNAVNLALRRSSRLRIQAMETCRGHLSAGPEDPPVRWSRGCLSQTLPAVHEKASSGELGRSLCPHNKMNEGLCLLANFVVYRK